MNPGREAKKYLRASQAKKAEMRKLHGPDLPGLAVEHEAEGCKDADVFQACLEKLYNKVVTQGRLTNVCA